MLTALAAALLGQPAFAQAPPVEVRVEADRRVVTVGDRIDLTVVVRHQEGLSPELPGPGTAFGELEVLAVEPPRERDLGNGRVETRLGFVVAAFRTGQLQVPPLLVPYTDAQGQRATASSEPLTVAVESVIPPGEEPTDIRDLKGQLSIPGGAPLWARPLVTAAAAAGAALAGALAWRWLARRRSQRRPAGPPPLPEDTARGELDRIAAQDLVSQGDYGTHYRLLSACLRSYISDRYRFPAFAFTTGELEAKMTGRGVDRWQARLIAALLEECDQVQFGLYRPAGPRAEADLTTAYEIVELTRPEAVVEEEEAALP